MNTSTYVQRHPDYWVNLPESYIRATVEALCGAGVQVPRAWMDPSDPRDATILVTPAGTRALVWDEETGWRTGDFVDGRQGVRTELADARYLGGGVLPPANQVAHLFREGASVAPHVYRSRSDVRDGLDDRFRH